jgi:cellulose synthase operon protein C
MTVRWKPLLFLSGVFLVVGLIGVVAITLTLGPRSSQDILRRARVAREAGRFENAEIYFKQALQHDSKSAAIHEEFAALYRDWAKHAPVEKRAMLHTERLDHLATAAKFDKAAKGPRRELLQEYMREDRTDYAIYWAKEVLNVEADNPDAHFVLAMEALESRTPNVSEARRHLETLEKKKVALLRLLLVRARLAVATGDQEARKAALAQAATIKLGPDASPVDHIFCAMLASFAIRDEADPAVLQQRVSSMLENVKALSLAEELAPARVGRLRLLLEQTQKALTLRSANVDPSAKKVIDRLVDAIEGDLESIFKLALSSSAEPDLQTYVDYADHLRLRLERDRCLETVERALKSPQALRRTRVAVLMVMNLHTVAVEMALSKSDDKGRFDKAAPHIQALLDCPEPRAQGLGNLFAGSVDLDRSGVAREISSAESAPVTREMAAKLRTSAVRHLKIAAAQLPEMAEAQARYGVALVLAGEQNLGRQFLQTALRLGGLDAQYQLWAAWAILQAGYPEEAEPIVGALMRELTAGRVSRELEGGICLLSGEIHQARRTPDELNKAAADFERCLATGREAGSTVVLRLAQIDVQLGRHDRALARIDALQSQGQGSPATEQLAVLALEEQGKKTEARSRLRAARTRYPAGADLAALDAALVAKDGKPDQADRILAEFLAKEPDNVTLVLMRAQLQVESLKNVEQARSLLLSIAEKTESSAPLVQLAGLELERNELAAAEAVIGKIRSRWKEAATSDVLEAQLALKRGQVAKAIEHFDAALKKDPDNKIVQLYKAQLDGQTGSVAEATKSLEAIVKNRPLKEVDPGTTLMSAAQSALASLSLRSGAFDDAIRRFEDLKQADQNGTLTKADRWQLISAYVARGNWSSAKREIAAILNDPKSPPTDEERVRGANFYRQQGEDGPALAQLDYVLAVNASNPAAVVTRSYILLKAKQYQQASAILHKAIELLNQKKEQPPAVFYVMLAAVENDQPPTTTALDRTIAVLDTGLGCQPDDLELIQAKYTALRASAKNAAAIEFMEAKAKSYPNGLLRRELVKVYREQRQFGKAAELLRALLKETPDDTNLAAALIQVVSIEADEAGALSQTDRQRELNNQAASMIREYRDRFPSSPLFVQAESEMAARRGDFTRAIDLTREIDKMSKTSPMGALLRARLYAAQGKTRDLAQSYSEALDRSPRLLDVRIFLGQTRLRLGDADDALRQANMVLDIEKNRPDAILLQARALVESGTTATEKDQRQLTAIARLEELTQSNPRFEDAFRTLAEIQLKRSNRSAAIAVLKQGLAANPNDAATVARLVELLAIRIPDNQAPNTADLADAKRIATEIAGRDQQGSVTLAVAIGLNKAHQFDLALPYAEGAAAKLNTPAAHLNYGDLLLTLAENQSDTQQRRGLLDRAVAEYDLVLKTQPNSIEAINNKAWILHSYLDQSRQALELVLGLQKRVNSGALPGEFYDTLGSIQESVGRTREAEQTYLDGLKKAPEHPVLNFHFGRMIASDHARAVKARSHLLKALAGDRLSPPMTKEATKLVQLIDKKSSIQ